MSARKIDDAYKRIGSKNSYRAKRFDGKRSMIDDYTGKRIFLDSSKHPAETAAQVDHVIPLNKVQRKYPDLSPEQQKKIANDPSNYAMTNGKLNMHVKNGKDNHTVVFEQLEDTIKSIFSVLQEVQEGTLSSAKKMTSECAKTSSNMIKHEVKASAKMKVNAIKCRTENLSGMIEDLSGSATASPEAALAGTIGNTAKEAIGGAIMGTMIAETVEAIGNNETMDSYIGAVAGKGTQAVLSASGGAVAGEVAGAVATALGANPAGVFLTSIGAGKYISDKISEVTEDLADDIGYAVYDGFEDLRSNCPLVDISFSAAETIGMGIESIWDNTFGLLFL